MAKINLLPWREELRKQQQQDFLVAILSAVGVTVLLMFFVRSHINGMIDNQAKRNSFLETEIAALDRKIKEIQELEDRKRKLIAKMDVIQQLQGSRPEIVHLFDEVAKSTPDGVHITKFAQSGNVLTFDGAAQSNARVSAYMRSLDASAWLANPKLGVINTKSKSNQGRVSEFTLTIQQQSQKKKDGSES